MAQLQMELFADRVVPDSRSLSIAADRAAAFGMPANISPGCAASDTEQLPNSPRTRRGNGAPTLLNRCRRRWRGPRPSARKRRGAQPKGTKSGGTSSEAPPLVVFRSPGTTLHAPAAGISSPCRPAGLGRSSAPACWRRRLRSSGTGRRWRQRSAERSA